MVQAVLDLATDAQDEVANEKGDEDEEQQVKDTNAHETALPTQEQQQTSAQDEEGQEISSHSAEGELLTNLALQGNEGEEVVMVTEILDAAIASPTTDEPSEESAGDEEDSINKAAAVTDILDAVVASPTSGESELRANEDADAEEEEDALPTPPAHETTDDDAEAALSLRLCLHQLTRLPMMMRRRLHPSGCASTSTCSRPCHRWLYESRGRPQ